jgi:hypothetical protein
MKASANAQSGAFRKLFLVNEWPDVADEPGRLGVRPP